MTLPGAKRTRQRLDRVVMRLPEVELRPGGEHGRHVAYMVSGKTFAYFTVDHHGDGRVELICKAPMGEQQALVTTEPARYFVPSYLGHRGWIGIWLDTETIDWREAEEHMTNAYRLTAPRRLSGLLET